MDIKLVASRMMHLRRPLVRAFSSAAATSTSSAPTNVLQLQLRDVEGSKASRRLRKQGLLPGIIYGDDGTGAPEDRTLVTIERRQFERIHRKLWTSIENHVFELQVDGKDEPIQALMRDAQFDPVTDLAVSVNFLRYKPGRKVSIPISYLNEEGSPGLKRGGYINPIIQELECEISTTHVPEALPIDVFGLHVGDKVYLDAITFPEGVKPLVKEGSMVAKIAGRRQLMPRKEVVEQVVEQVVEEEEEDEEFDEWNDIF